MKQCKPNRVSWIIFINISFWTLIPKTWPLTFQTFMMDGLEKSNVNKIELRLGGPSELLILSKWSSHHSCHLFFDQIACQIFIASFVIWHFSNWFCVYVRGKSDLQWHSQLQLYQMIFPIKSGQWKLTFNQFMLILTCTEWKWNCFRR